jgi:hypothetical protein
VVIFNWTRDEGELVCHRRVLAPRCDWSEIDALCRKLSPLLDRHDRDRFARLLGYGGPLG